MQGGPCTDRDRLRGDYGDGGAMMQSEELRLASKTMASRAGPREEADQARHTRRHGLIARVVSGARTRVFELLVLLFSLIFGFAIMTYFKVVFRRREVRFTLWLWSTMFIWSARWILGVRWRIEAAENIPDHPVIFVSNHQSYWESIAMTSFIRDVNVVTKKATMSIPVFGWGLKHSPMIAVDKENPGANIRRMLREAKASIAQGRSILIFPEGTRINPHRTREHERGFEILYRTCGVEVVPVIVNAGEVWRRGFQTKHPGTITMRFMKPRPAGQPPQEFAREIEAFLNVEKERMPSTAPGQASSGQLWGGKIVD